MDRIDAITSGLTIETLQAAKKYYLQVGEPAERLTIEQLRNFIGDHFFHLLDCHFNDSFARGDIEFTKEKKEIFAKLPAMDIRQREDLSSALWGIFGAGYEYGYIMGIKDTETFLHTLKDAEEAERLENLDELMKGMKVVSTEERTEP